MSSISSYAQNLEDVMLWRALHQVERGFYVDIGAQDPVVDSISRAFYEKGWRGVHVEPTSAYADMLRKDRPDEEVLQVAVADHQGLLPFFEIGGTGLSTGQPEIAAEHGRNGYAVREISVPCVTLDSILQRHVDREVHWLKIDVEGFERQILQGWTLSEPKPWIVVVESTAPMTQRDTSKDWEEQLLHRGYEMAYFDGLNRFYVSSEHDELKAALRAPPNVFDAFTLSGTASSSFAARLKADAAAAIDRERESNQHLDELQLQLSQTKSLQEKSSLELDGAREKEARLREELDRLNAAISTLGTAVHDEIGQPLAPRNASVSTAGGVEYLRDAFVGLRIRHEQMLSSESLLRAQLDGRIRESAGLEARLAAELGQTDRLHKLSQDTVALLHASHGELSALRQHALAKQHELASLELRLRELQAQLSEATANFRSIENSRSWRITLPFRLVFQWARRVAGRVKAAWKAIRFFSRRAENSTMASATGARRASRSTGSARVLQRARSFTKRTAFYHWAAPHLKRRYPMLWMRVRAVVLQHAATVIAPVPPRDAGQDLPGAGVGMPVTSSVSAGTRRLDTVPERATIEDLTSHIEREIADRRAR